MMCCEIKDKKEKPGSTSSEASRGTRVTGSGNVHTFESVACRAPKPGCSRFKKSRTPSTQGSQHTKQPGCCFSSSGVLRMSWGGEFAQAFKLPSHCWSRIPDIDAALSLSRLQQRWATCEAKSELSSSIIRRIENRGYQKDCTKEPSDCDDGQKKATYRVQGRDPSMVRTCLSKGGGNVVPPSEERDNGQDFHTSVKPWWHLPS